jgi:hypothetical protein
MPEISLIFILSLGIRVIDSSKVMFAMLAL